MKKSIYFIWKIILTSTTDYLIIAIRFEKYIFILLDFLFINIETSPINILSNIIQREETM